MPITKKVDKSQKDLKQSINQKVIFLPNTDRYKVPWNCSYSILLIHEFPQENVLLSAPGGNMAVSVRRFRGDSNNEYDAKDACVCFGRVCGFVATSNGLWSSL